MSWLHAQILNECRFSQPMHQNEYEWHESLGGSLWLQGEKNITLIAWELVSVVYTNKLDRPLSPLSTGILPGFWGNVHHNIGWWATLLPALKVYNSPSAPGTTATPERELGYYSNTWMVAPLHTMVVWVDYQGNWSSSLEEPCVCVRVRVVTTIDDYWLWKPLWAPGSVWCKTAWFMGYWHTYSSWVHVPICIGHKVHC